MDPKEYAEWFMNNQWQIQGACIAELEATIRRAQREAWNEALSKAMDLAKTVGCCINCDRCGACDYFDAIHKLKRQEGEA